MEHRRKEEKAKFIKKISSVSAQSMHTAEIKKIICIWNPPGSNRLCHAPVHVCTQKHIIKALPHCYIIIICRVHMPFFVGDLDTESALSLYLSLSHLFRYALRAHAWKRRNCLVALKCLTDCSKFMMLLPKNNLLSLKFIVKAEFQMYGHTFSVLTLFWSVL
jgi:hypothetical protein